MAAGHQGSVHQDGVTSPSLPMSRRQVTESHGGRVVWHVIGQGRPLVLLHGGHGSWRHWSRNMAVLATQRAVWVPDIPGYGASDALTDDTLEALLQRLAGSLDTALGPSACIDLAGFSFGGLVAAHLAQRRGCVERLALIGPAGHGGARRPRGELLNWRAATNAQALQDAMRHNLLAHMLHNEASVDALALQIHTEACQHTRFRSKPISRSGGLHSLLQRFKGPLLLAWGEHDVTADPMRLAPELAAGRPNIRTAIVPDAGHWLQYEAAQATNTLLRDWMTTTVTH